MLCRWRNSIAVVNIAGLSFAIMTLLIKEPKRGQFSQGRMTATMDVIAIEENETNEQAYQRCFPDGSIKPRTVIYATPLDVML